jgi:hypothetical protein
LLPLAGSIQMLPAPVHVSGSGENAQVAGVPGV